MKAYKILFALGLFAFFITTNTFSADLKTLMEIGASQADIAKTLREETNTYNAIKSAIASSAIKTGMTADSIRKKYGEPIIATYDKKRDATRWLYMPATSSHFKGEKAYLYFDKENKLTGCEVVEQ